MLTIARRLNHIVQQRRSIVNTYPTFFSSNITKEHSATLYNTDNKKKPIAPILMGSIVRIQELLSNHKQYLDKDVEVAGWVKSCRKSGNGEFAFIELSDGSSMNNLQLVVFNSLENWEDIHKLKTAACIRVRGRIVPSEGKSQ